MIKYAAGFHVVIVSLFVPLEVMAQVFSDYLDFSPDQCPAAMSPDRPRNLFQPDTVDHADGSPVELIDEIRLVVAEQAFVGPRGFFFTTAYEENIYRRLFGDIGSLGTLPPIVFLMPESRPIEGHPIPDWHNFCQAGREPPSSTQRKVSAEVHLCGSSIFDSGFERRRKWPRQIGQLIGASIDDVLQGLVLGREGRVVSGIVGMAASRQRRMCRVDQHRQRVS